MKLQILQFYNFNFIEKHAHQQKLIHPLLSTVHYLVTCNAVASRVGRLHAGHVTNRYIYAQRLTRLELKKILCLLVTSDALA